MDVQETDSRLREIFRRNAPSFDGTPLPLRLRSDPRSTPAGPSRRRYLRSAAVAFGVVVLVAALGTGIFEAVAYLGGLGEHGPSLGEGPALVIGDQTTETSAPGTTTQTAPRKLPSGFWMRLPLATVGRATISTLIMDPSNPSVLYVATSVGLFKSTDGAGSWSQLPTVPGDVGVLFIDPTSPSTIYVVCTIAQEADEGVSDHLLRSDDGGLTWTDLTEAGAPRKTGDIWLATTFDTKTTPSTVYMWDDTGYVWRSTDRGTTWTRLSVAEGPQAVAHAATPRSMPAAAQRALDTFLASSDGTINDADTGTVVPIATGPGADPILVDPEHLSTMYLATVVFQLGGGSVYKSTDAGRTWRKASPDLVIPDPAVNGILVDPNTHSTIYATTNSGIYRSTNGGSDWARILGGGGWEGWSSLLLAPSPPGLYASTSEGMFRSDDGGTSWTTVEGAGLPGKDSGAVTPKLALAVADQAGVLLAAVMEFGWGPTYLYRSADAGESWQRTGLELGADFFGPLVVADPQHPSTIYAWGRKDDSFLRLFRSTDAGATWAETDLDSKKWDVPDRNTEVVVGLEVDPDTPETIWAVQDDLSDNGHSIIHRSTDGGATWSQVKFDGLEKWIGWLIFDRRSPGTLYALSGSTDPWGGAVYRSTDAGATWEKLGENAPTNYLPVVTPDPAPGGALYAATGGGLFKWVPNGN